MSDVIVNSYKGRMTEFFEESDNILQFIGKMTHSSTLNMTKTQLMTFDRGLIMSTQTSTLSLCSKSLLTIMDKEFVLSLMS